MLPISTRTSSALRPLPVSRLERRKLWRNTNSSVSSFEFLYTYDLPAPCKARVSVGSRLHFRRARSASKPSNSGSWSWPFWNQSIPSTKGYLHGSWVMKSLVQYEHSIRQSEDHQQWSLQPRCWTSRGLGRRRSKPSDLLWCLHSLVE